MCNFNSYLVSLQMEDKCLSRSGQRDVVHLLSPGSPGYLRYVVRNTSHQLRTSAHRLMYDLPPFSPSCDAVMSDRKGTGKFVMYICHFLAV